MDLKLQTFLFSQIVADTVLGAGRTSTVRSTVHISLLEEVWVQTQESRAFRSSYQRALGTALLSFNLISKHHNGHVNVTCKAMYLIKKISRIARLPLFIKNKQTKNIVQF